MVVVEPLEINNEAACPLKVLSHLGSNKRKRERNKEGERIVIEILLLLPLSLSLPFFPFAVSLSDPRLCLLHGQDDDRESKLSARRTKS